MSNVVSLNPPPISGEYGAEYDKLFSTVLYYVYGGEEKELVASFAEEIGQGENVSSTWLIKKLAEGNSLVRAEVSDKVHLFPISPEMQERLDSRINEKCAELRAKVLEIYGDAESLLSAFQQHTDRYHEQYSSLEEARLNWYKLAITADIQYRESRKSIWIVRLLLKICGRRT